MKKMLYLVYESIINTVSVFLLVLVKIERFAKMVNHYCYLESKVYYYMAIKHVQPK